MDHPARRRARRLVRWYPPAWRARYGDEFAELLVADMAERPRSWRRAVDVARCGLRARFAAAEPASASLAVLVCALGAFLLFGLALWSQLLIGWQWSAPDSPSTVLAVAVMSGAAVLLGVLAAAAAVPAVACVPWRSATRPLLLALLGAAVLAIGGHQFAADWPGTGGRPWGTGRALVPGGVAALCWALTRSVTAYWAHPGALRAFSPAEIAWMSGSPLALACVVAGLAGVVRRLRLPADLLRYEARLAGLAAAAMAAFLAGAACWVVAGGPGPRGLFHAGVIDVVDLVVMAGALAVACRAAQRVVSA